MPSILVHVHVKAHDQAHGLQARTAQASSVMAAMHCCDADDRIEASSYSRKTSPQRTCSDRLLAARKATTCMLHTHTTARCMRAKHRAMAHGMMSSSFYSPYYCLLPRRHAKPNHGMQKWSKCPPKTAATCVCMLYRTRMCTSHQIQRTALIREAISSRYFFS